MDDELKLAGLEALVPDDVEKHLMINANRLDTYDKARLEVVTYVEARTGTKMKAETLKPGGAGSSGRAGGGRPSAGAPRPRGTRPRSPSCPTPSRSGGCPG